eukprot:4917448-Amphidinium_carterae.2
MASCLVCSGRLLETSTTSPQPCIFFSCMCKVSKFEAYISARLEDSMDGRSRRLPVWGGGTPPQPDAQNKLHIRAGSWENTGKRSIFSMTTFGVVSLIRRRLLSVRSNKSVSKDPDEVIKGIRPNH